ncbi:MAG: hypothetical protein KDD82_17975 [Planctomycetes bacterium]|nr:hypothetical protein [Planctomycetota bacterium]
MKDKTDKLLQQGVFIMVLMVVMLMLNWMSLQSINTLDRNEQNKLDQLAEKLDQQREGIRDLNGELRRMQDNQKLTEELRLALKEGMQNFGARMPQPVYVAPQQGTPVQQAPQQPPQQAVEVTPPADTPATEPEHTASTEGMAEATSGMGTDDAIPGPDPNAKIGGTYVATTAEPSTLNLLTTSEGTTLQIMRYVVEPMFTLSEQDATKIDPLLATHWKLAPDNMSITFHLRQGVTWSDGAPFTADDVLFTWNTMMDPEVKAESSRGDYKDVESVEKLDDFTIKVSFKQPDWTIQYSFGSNLYVLPRHFYEQEVRDYAAANNIAEGSYSVIPGQPGFGKIFNELQAPCVGTGPYMMPEDGWERGQSLRLERNPNWWMHSIQQGVWNLQTLRWRFIRDQVQQVNQARQQKIDVLVIDEDQWEDSLRHEGVFADNYEYYNYDHQGLGYNYIVWNCRKFPFDDARVRRAMTHSIDRKTLLHDMWRDNGQIATCINKPVYPEYNKDLKPLEFSLSKAAQLLKEAGFKDVDNDGILDKEVDGVWKPFKFTFTVPSGRSEYTRIGTHLKENLARIGVVLEVLPLEWATFIEDLYVHNFDAMCLYNSFQSAWIDNYASVHSSEDKERGSNVPGYHTPELDQLVTDIRREFDRDKRIPMFHKLYKILQEAQPRTLLIHGRVSVILHKRFRNVIVRHKGMRSTYWWVDPKDVRY